MSYPSSHPPLSLLQYSLSVEMGSAAQQVGSPTTPKSVAGTRSLLAQQRAVIKGEQRGVPGRFASNGRSASRALVDDRGMVCACVITEQDEILDDIGEGVSRLKDHGKRIQEETEVQLVSVIGAAFDLDRRTFTVMSDE